MSHPKSESQIPSQAAEDSSAQLFQPSNAPTVGAGVASLFIASISLVFGGFWVISLAFSYSEWAFHLFGAGILLDAVGLWFAFTVLPGKFGAGS